MSRRLPTSVLALVPMLLVVSACDDSEPTSPPEVGPVQLTLNLSSLAGDPDDPVTLTARAWRTGDDKIRAFRDSCAPWVWIELTDPAGNTILAERYIPCERPPLEYDLDAKGVSTEQVFNGTIWEGWTEHEGLAGYYEVTARFSYRIPPLSGRRTTITVSKGFLWDDPLQP